MVVADGLFDIEIHRCYGMNLWARDLIFKKFVLFHKIFTKKLLKVLQILSHVAHHMFEAFLIVIFHLL